MHSLSPLFRPSWEARKDKQLPRPLHLAGHRGTCQTGRTSSPWILCDVSKQYTRSFSEQDWSAFRPKLLVARLVSRRRSGAQRKGAPSVCRIGRRRKAIGRFPTVIFRHPRRCARHVKDAYRGRSYFGRRGGGAPSVITVTRGDYADVGRRYPVIYSLLRPVYFLDLISGILIPCCPIFVAGGKRWCYIAPTDLPAYPVGGNERREFVLSESWAAPSSSATSDTRGPSS